MTIETGKWWACDYEIKKLTPVRRFYLEPLRVISAKRNSSIRIYDPLIFEGEIKHEDVGKKPYQPETADIGGRPPHIELARLNTTNVNDILTFTSKYGLLGLWGVKGEALDWLEGNDHQRTCSLSLMESVLPGGSTLGYRDHFEPLDSFIAATKRFQSAFSLLEAIRDKHPERYNGELWSKFIGIANPYIEAIHPRISRDMKTGLPMIVWDFKSLINVCYFRLIQDATGSMLTNCGLKKCGKPFLARNNEDNYCSKECRHKGTMANLAVRRVKNDLRDMEKRGVINKSLRWAAGKEAQKLYSGGLRDYEKLLQKVTLFIGQEKSKEGQNNGKR